MKIRVRGAKWIERAKRFAEVSRGDYIFQELVLEDARYSESQLALTKTLYKISETMPDTDEVRTFRSEFRERLLSLRNSGIYFLLQAFFIILLYAVDGAQLGDYISIIYLLLAKFILGIGLLQQKGIYRHWGILAALYFLYTEVWPQSEGWFIVAAVVFLFGYLAILIPLIGRAKKWKNYLGGAFFAAYTLVMLFIIVLG